MASFTTVITEFNDSNEKREYSVNGHTVQKPKMLVQFRKRPVGATGVAENRLVVSYGTEDSSGEYLSPKVTLEAKVRNPANGIAADLTAALAVFRDFVASDEFTDMCTNQNYVQ